MKKTSQRIYLDHAASTPLDKKVVLVMDKFQKEFYGNPNSIHFEGQQARAKIDFAREEIGKSIFAKPQEIIFTSGATEVNNLAVMGIVSKAIFESRLKPHVITTTLEHQSVYNIVKSLEEKEIIEATYIKPDSSGVINAEQITKEIKDNTVLVSTIFVSNEIGSVLPIREIGKMLTEVNAKQKHKIYFHTDAVQAFKYYNCHVQKLGVDLMTLSAHKINGPKGIGALFVKSGTKIDSMMSGGSQEYGLRPGTQNSVGIIGFAEAVKILGDFEAKQKVGESIRKITEPAIKELTKIPNIEINGPTGEQRTPDNINFTIKGMDQEMVIAKLDLAGFAVSTGSACVSGSAEPSHVITSLGKNYKDPSATVRITLGRENTSAEIKSFIKTISEIAK